MAASRLRFQGSPDGVDAEDDQQNWPGIVKAEIEKMERRYQKPETDHDPPSAFSALDRVIGIHELRDADGDDDQRPEMRNRSEVNEIEVVEKKKQPNDQQDCSRYC
jgi:hypothetical protein